MASTQQFGPAGLARQGNLGKLTTQEPQPLSTKQGYLTGESLTALARQGKLMTGVQEPQPLSVKQGYVTGGRLTATGLTAAGGSRMARRQPAAVQVGPVGRARTLRSRGGLHRPAARGVSLGRGRGFGNRSLSRFRRP